MRLWRFDGRGLRLAGGADPGWIPATPHGPGLVPTRLGATWLEAVPGVDGFWLEVACGDEATAGAASEAIRPVFEALLGTRRELAQLAEELAARYEEIDLLYTISEILGQTVRLDEAARTILREVSSVVGARRGSIMVYDEVPRMLRIVAARGFRSEVDQSLSVDEPTSVAARAVRERRIIAYDPREDDAVDALTTAERGYLGQAFLSVPITYAAPGADVRCIGVINLTDRLGGDAFTSSNRKLVAAIANQIGAAIENARLVQRDLRQQRVRREMELAHDLQLKLLPDPSVLQDDAVVAARCLPAESVGGDFYTFTRLGSGRVGVMVGDVSSHGFPAALVMALVLSAAGIHAGVAASPDETLAALLDSLGPDLASTEMYFTVFYGVFDPPSSRLVYASAGHPHAFRIPAQGAPVRLETTAPPLGLAEADSIGVRQVPWSRGHDLLCLWTDGLVDGRDGEGAVFGEERLLNAISARRALEPEQIVAQVVGEVEAFAPTPVDDRTLLVLRI